MEFVEMHIGERRIITVEISSCDVESFVIRNPTYRLVYGSTVEDKGAPILQEHELTITVEPRRVGKYTLECTMDIADETIIPKIEVLVRG